MDAAGGMPQSLEFNLSTSSECETLAEFLKTSGRRDRDPRSGQRAAALLNLLLKLKIPYDIFIADAGLLGPPTPAVGRSATFSSSQRKRS